LKSGGTYEKGTWVRTPTLGAGDDIETDPYYYYVDITKGVIVRYAYVNETFTFLPSAGETLADSFSTLSSKGTISAVSAQNGDGFQSTFQYKPRFLPQSYLSYKPTANSEVQYYFTLTGLTPTSQNPQDLISAGLLSRVDTSPELRAQFIAAITPSPETGASVVCPPVPMFVFSPGDTTLFRTGATVNSYVATRTSHPHLLQASTFRIRFLSPAVW
jgi:hypothetical protein